MMKMIIGNNNDRSFFSNKHTQLYTFAAAAAAAAAAVAVVVNVLSP